eukprot:TRINITY_DN500_c0_g2_i1.p1 TRINITY_DN500_c0_g2~~TRINITY_DN500_c0_g2_i1.p1  ORF type:complete len:204 (+),score=23.86 TRINITY_DN500_c0_g2_i1:118-729(+)
MVEVTKQMVLAFVAIATASSFILFVLSCDQIKSVTSTPNGSQLLVSGNNDLPCSSPNNVYVLNRPFKIYLGTDNKALECPWQTPNTAARIFGSLVAMLAGVLVMLVVFKDLEKWIWSAASAVCAVFGIWMFAMVIADGIDAHSAYQWCHKKMPGAIFKPPTANIRCDSAGFNAVAFLDFFSSLWWFASLAVLVIFSKNKPAAA